MATQMAKPSSVSIHREGRFIRVLLFPFLGAFVLLGGCIPQPIAHKKVKRRPPDPDIVSSRLGYTSTTAPGLLRDDQVKPVTLLLPTFEERSEQQVAAEALSQIGPQAVPELCGALQSPNPRIRREAAGVLVRMGPDAKDAVPDLILLLDDEDEATRKMAARALGRIGPDAASAVPALMRTLLETQPSVLQQ
ncbi:MAG: HEAT repeat domain-containing protein [Pirellulaceae bacterium]|nr:HEAT repeat domain-containing protein [Pirellulaceae bacterium]